MIRFLFFKVLGWKITGQFDPAIKKSVIIVAPHTSWVDFIIGAMARHVIQLESNFIAKKELFKGLLGRYLRWMGGAPVDRGKNQNNVEAIAEVFQQKEQFRLALAPEGTRKPVKKWRTGFYYIALLAKIPIIPVAFDYPHKTIRIGEPFYPTGNLEEDLRELHQFYKGIQGFYNTQ